MNMVIVDGHSVTHGGPGPYEVVTFETGLSVVKGGGELARDMNNANYELMMPDFAKRVCAALNDLCKDDA